MTDGRALSTQDKKAAFKHKQVRDFNRCAAVRRRATAFGQKCECETPRDTHKRKKALGSLNPSLLKKIIIIKKKVTDKQHQGKRIKKHKKKKRSPNQSAARRSQADN